MIAFLVIAHHAPEHAARLTRRLVSEKSAVFLHVDAKIDIRLFVPVITAGAICTRRRHNVFWGGWSQVAATLELIRTAIDHSDEFTHFALLSGADYPMARPDEMLRYLQAEDREHINCVRMPADHLDKPLTRLTERHLEGGSKRQGLQARTIRCVNRLLRRLPPRNLDRSLQGLVPHAGSQWWILSREAVEQALKLDEGGGPAMRVFKTSRCPDEMFFQTVVASHCGPERIGRSATYTDWNGGLSPAVLTDAHIRLVTSDGFELGGPFVSCPCLFVRKFPTDRDDLRDMVDQYSDTRKIVPSRTAAVRMEAHEPSARADTAARA